MPHCVGGQAAVARGDSLVQNGEGVADGSIPCLCQQRQCIVIGFDLLAADQIFANGDTLTMNDPLGTLNMSGVAKVLAAPPPSGITDTVEKRSIDFVLTLQGNWVTGT